MKRLIIMFTLLVGGLLLLAAPLATAGDFDWTRNLNIRAEADPSGFRASLATRFNLGDAEIRVVLGNVDSPADAYIVCRLGEMASKPIDDVLQRYRIEKSQGWGPLAKSLGIKPGSKEFHALKHRPDIESAPDKSKAKKNNGKSKGKG